MKYLALDIGEARIGVAASDEDGIITRPLLALSVDHELMERLGKVIDEEKPQKVIFGIPRHASGQEAVVAEEIREFAKGVSLEYNVEVDFEDESATSIEAEKRLKESGKSISEIKKLIDAEAAAIILEAYLARTK